MKNEFNNSLYSVLLVPLVAMFFSTGTINAQNGIQNNQQSNNKTQKFYDVDANRDGFVDETEYQLGSLDEFDTNNDKKLSRIEYQTANRSNLGNKQGNGISGRNKGCGMGQGINQGNGRSGRNKGNGMGQGINQGNGQNQGTVDCPYNNQCTWNPNNTKTNGQKIPQ